MVCELVPSKWVTPEGDIYIVQCVSVGLWEEAGVLPQYAPYKSALVSPVPEILICPDSWYASS